jgi:hypothetical protein
MYNINFNQLLAELLPPMLRLKAIVYNYCLAALSPVRDLHTQFIQFRNEAIYKASFTSQVIYLEKRLNDRFDAIMRRIYINNVADLPFVYAFNSSENENLFAYNNYDSAITYQVDDYCSTPTGVYKCIATSTGNLPDTSANFVWQHENTYLMNVSEMNLANDFIVMVESSITFDANEMRSIVNYYKLAGKRFTIQIY